MTAPVRRPPWWYWALALVVVPLVALAAFLGLGALFRWTGTGAWVAGLVSGAGGIAVLVAVGQRLALARFWTGLGVLVACVATPAWAFGLVVGLFWIYCPEGCFN